MKNLLPHINEIKYPFHSKETLIKELEGLYELISTGLAYFEKKKLREDFDFFLRKGRWNVHNTFAGGIIFLREPETINNIKIEFNSKQNEALASVEYSSKKRNARNVKYKPDAGKVESTKWNMLGVFPNFNTHSKSVQFTLAALIGIITKRICEYHKRESWFMEFEKEFDIELFFGWEISIEISC